jgi:hypothetical protein
MKSLLAICMLAATPFAGAAGTPAPASSAVTSTAPTVAPVKGEVLEVKDVESYTYLRLKTQGGETWAAVGKAPVKIGAQVTIENAMVMHNFQSKSLKMTFPIIVFGTLGGAAGSMPGAGHGAMGHGAKAMPAVDVANIHVPKATGANAYTVSEIITKAAELKDKPVVVRGKIVKYNPEIMGKNWIHLQDGTGSADKATNDILVTTGNQAKLGDVVTAKGVVHANKDFGAGYSYKVLIEEATLQP